MVGKRLLTVGWPGPSDRFDRVEQMRWSHVATPRVDKEWVQYGFDAVANVLFRQNLHAPVSTLQDEAYQYDKLNQLVKLARGNINVNRSAIRNTPAWEEDWSLDPSGNWQGNGDPASAQGNGYTASVDGTPTLVQNRVHDKANTLTQIENATGDPWWPVDSDQNGNLTAGPSGAIPTAQVQGQYDAWNRLVYAGINRGSGAVSALPGVEANLSYDGLNRFVAKACARYPAGLPGSTTTQDRYVYSDQWQLLDASGYTTSSSSPEPVSDSYRKNFMWGLRYPDDLLRRDRASSSGTTTPPIILTEHLYALHDYLNVTAIWDPSTGNVVQRFGYDGYGKPRVLDASFAPTTDSYDWEFRFNAARYDPDSGLYLMRNRWYHPLLGRWISKDPQASVLGINQYQFASGGPVTRADPLGLWDSTPITTIFPCPDEKTILACCYICAVNGETFVGCIVVRTTRWHFNWGGPFGFVLDYIAVWQRYCVCTNGVKILVGKGKS